MAKSKTALEAQAELHEAVQGLWRIIVRQWRLEEAVAWLSRRLERR